MSPPDFATYGQRDQSPMGTRLAKPNGPGRGSDQGQSLNPLWPLIQNLQGHISAHRQACQAETIR
jgi:hypothetical protein